MYKNILYAVAGAVVGSAATYFIMRNKFAEQAQNDINEMKEYYANQNKKMDEDGEENVDIPENRNNSAEVKEAKKISGYMNYTSYSDLMKGESPTAFESSLNQKPNDNEEDEEEEPDFADFDHPTEGPADMPYPITSADYSNGNANFDKLAWIFYAGDSTFVDEDGDIIDDPRGIIGVDDQQIMGLPIEDGSVFLRNEKLGADYEVVIDQGPYPYR